MTRTRLPMDIRPSFQIMSIAATESLEQPCEAGHGGIDFEPWMA